MVRSEPGQGRPARGALLLAALALVPVAAIACSSDDDAPPLLGAPIGGGAELGGGGNDASLGGGDAQGGAAASDGSAGDGGDGGDGSVCAAKPTILLDFNASTCGRCFVTQCAALVDACLDDCTCGMGLQTAFDCFKLGGSDFSCDATAVNEVPASDQKVLLACQETCAATCTQDGGVALDGADD